MIEGRLTGQVVVVTGAGRGIGAAIAKHAATHGASVLVNDIDLTPAEAVAAEIVDAGGRAMAQAGNIADWDEAGATIQAALDGFGRLDGLVNNAGVFGMARPEEQDPAEFRRLIEINVFGVAYPGLHAIRHLRAQGRGSIVNVTSSAIAGLPSMGAYGASKGAVASLTLNWALDLAGSGVRVNALSPIAQTRMQYVRMDYEGLAGADREAAEQQRTVDPSFNAPPAIFLLSDQAADINGQIVQVGRGNQLALLTPSRQLEPSVTIEPGSDADVDRAFTEVLRHQLQRPGL